MSVTIDAFVALKEMIDNSTKNVGKYDAEIDRLKEDVARPPVDADPKSCAITNSQSQQKNANNEHGGQGVDTRALKGAVAELRTYFVTLKQYSKQHIKSLK